MFGNDGRGLRGGSYTLTRSDTAIDFELNAVRFVEDVSIQRAATLDRTSSTLDATVEVDGPGNNDGTLTFHAVLWDPRHPQARSAAHSATERSLC